MSASTLIGWTVIVLTIAGAAMVLAYGKTLLAHWRRPRKFCAGPVQQGWKGLAPWSCFFRPACQYDIAGLPIDSQGLITCPECGSKQDKATALRGPGRIRFGRMAFALLGSAGTLSCASLISAGHWAQFVPSTALVVTERVLASQQPRLAQRELDRRYKNDELANWQEQAFIRILVGRLRDDDVHWNADRAIDQLVTFGTAVVPALEVALDSQDLQQRQLAAHVLRSFPGYRPTDKMLAVTMEGLRHDNVPIPNAREGVAYLAVHVDAAEQFIRIGLKSSDPQQRLLTAEVVCRSRRVLFLESAVSILAERLKDNQVSEDAKHAAYWLCEVGPSVVAYLEPYLESGDSQQRDLTRLIIKWVLRDPNDQPVGFRVYWGAFSPVPPDHNGWMRNLGSPD